MATGHPFVGTTKIPAGITTVHMLYTWGAKSHITKYWQRLQQYFMATN